MHHEILLQMMSGELHLAPLEAPHRILDIGTGTGIWAIDIADKYPSTEVIGTDIRYVTTAVSSLSSWASPGDSIFCQRRC
jgi:methylase of polypeptide subunit release factors